MTHLYILLCIIMHFLLFLIRLAYFLSYKFPMIYVPLFLSYKFMHSFFYLFFVSEGLIRSKRQTILSVSAVHRYLNFDFFPSLFTFNAARQEFAIPFEKLCSPVHSDERPNYQFILLLHNYPIYTLTFTSIDNTTTFRRTTFLYRIQMCIFP